MITHGALQIDGTEQDGALRIQVLLDSFDTQNPKRNVYYSDVRDYTTKFTATVGAGGKTGQGRKIFDVGTTDLTNKELMDPANNGAGVLRDLWTDPNGNFQGRYEVGVSDCRLMRTV